MQQSMNRETLAEELRRDEAVRTEVYTDSVGKLTIGVGWNLTDNGLPMSIIDNLLDIGMDTALVDAQALVSEGVFEKLCDARQRVLCNMAFNMGRPVLATFKRFLAAVRENDWELAALEMLDSRWARQVGPRARRLAEMMRRG